MKKKLRRRLKGVPEIKAEGDGLRVKSVTQQEVERVVGRSVAAPDDSERLLESGAEARITDIGVGSFLLASQLLPPWWSSTRDRALFEFWRKVNLLSGAVTSMTSKLTAIPFYVEARDRSIRAHVELAEAFTHRLMELSEYGRGWTEFFSMQVESLLTQDNGRFFEIVGDGDPDGLLTSAVMTIKHLDSQRCIRTRDPVFPVVYYDDKNRPHKMHYARVAFDSQQPSPRVRMNGVGFCAVSRATSYAQNLLDISNYKEEKLGSRPLRGLLLGSGGLDAEAIGQAIEENASVSDSKSLTRFSEIPIIAEPALDKPDLKIISFSSLPDGFSEKDATQIAMSAIALAFGVDLRELWPASDVGANRADAILSHIKSRGKGTGQILEATERLFNSKVLPKTLRLVFDFQDDAQDRQVSEIKDRRALTRDRNRKAQITTPRVERLNMLSDGDITEDQFEEMELEDGRLGDGEPVEVLFFSDDPFFKEMLAFSGTDDPINSPPPEEEIQSRINDVMRILANVVRPDARKQARKALAALQSILPEEELMLTGDQPQELDEDGKPILDPKRGTLPAMGRTRPGPDTPAGNVSGDFSRDQNKP